MAFAFALAFTTLYPKNKIISFIFILWALYVGISVSISIHWFSEFIAGAILGSLVGVVVGKSFRSKLING